jgi:hypothetical protein
VKTYSCGAANDWDWSFCFFGLSGSYQCPINQLEIVNYNKNVVILNNYPKNYNLAFGNSTKMNWVTNETGSSPVVGLFLGFNAPCANAKQQYVKRPNATADVYVDNLDSCTYSDDSSNQANLQYSSSGYNTSELAIYKANNIYNSIRDWVPAFSDDGLKADNYTLYYKTYSLWKQRCQLVYTTEQVAAEG